MGLCSVLCFHNFKKSAYNVQGKPRSPALYFLRRKRLRIVTTEPKPFGTKGLDKQLQILVLIQFVTGQLTGKLSLNLLSIVSASECIIIILKGA